MQNLQRKVTQAFLQLVEHHPSGFDPAVVAPQISRSFRDSYVGQLPRDRRRGIGGSFELFFMLWEYYSFIMPTRDGSWTYTRAGLLLAHSLMAVAEESIQIEVSRLNSMEVDFDLNEEIRDRDSPLDLVLDESFQLEGPAIELALDQSVVKIRLDPSVLRHFGWEDTVEVDVLEMSL